MRRGRYAPGCVSARINAGPLCLDVLRCQNFPACYSRATFMKRGFHTFAIYVDSPSATANLPVTIARVLPPPPLYDLYTLQLCPSTFHQIITLAKYALAYNTFVSRARHALFNRTFAIPDCTPPLRVLLIALTRVYIELLPVVPAAGLS